MVTEQMGEITWGSRDTCTDHQAQLPLQPGQGGTQGCLTVNEALLILENVFKLLRQLFQISSLIWRYVLTPFPIKELL